MIYKIVISRDVQSQLTVPEGVQASEEEEEEADATKIMRMIVRHAC